MASDDVLVKLDSISRRDDVGFEEYMVSLRGLQGSVYMLFWWDGCCRLINQVITSVVLSLTLMLRSKERDIRFKEGRGIGVGVMVLHIS